MRDERRFFRRSLRAHTAVKGNRETNTPSNGQAPLDTQPKRDRDMHDRSVDLGDDFEPVLARWSPPAL